MDGTIERSSFAGAAWSCLLALLMALASANPAAAGDFRLATVALEGEPAPGGGADYRSFFGISLNDVGDIGISAGLTGGPAHQAIFVLRTDGGVDAVLSSDAPPLELGERYAYLGIPDLNDAGDFVFGVGIGDVANGGAWLRAGGAAPTVIAAVGDTIPGLPETTTYDENPSEIQLNDADQILLTSRLRTPVHADDSALFLIDGATQDIVAMSGDAAPIPGGALFTTVGTEAHFNDAGAIVFFAHTDAPSAPRGVFAREGGGLVAVALEGRAAPVAGGRSFSFASTPQPQVNAEGAIAFSSWLEPYDEGGANEGIFLADGGTITKLVLTGDRVPGTRRVFQEVVRPLIDSRGNVVFLGSSYTATGQLVQGFYRIRRGWLGTVLETGRVVPGTGGAALERLSFWDIQWNDRGTLLFGATLDDGRRGVFRADPGPPRARNDARPRGCSPRAARGPGCR